MAISRPFLLALLAAALLGATYFAVQGGRDEAGGVANVSQPTSPQPAQPTRLTPDQTLEAAFSTDKLDSARFDAALRIRFGGSPGTLRVTGAFENGLSPKLDVRARVRGVGADSLDIGFVTTGDRAWFLQNGTGYQVPQQAWSQIVSARDDKGGAKQSAIDLPFDPRTWLRDVRSHGTAKVNGVETEHVSASIDAPAAVRDIAKLVQSSGAAAADELPENLESSVNKIVKRADFDVYVSKDDNLLRRLTGRLRLALPGAGPLVANLRVDLDKVGQPQRVVAPAKVVKGLPRGSFGNFSRGLLAGIAGTAGADAEAVAAAASPGARQFRRALAKDRKVVLFFSQGAADDRATARAVESLRGVLVIRDDVDNVDAYGKLVQQLNVDQAPTLVVVGRNHEARLMQGYVDSGVVAQAVADAR